MRALPTLLESKAMEAYGILSTAAGSSLPLEHEVEPIIWTESGSR